MRSEEDLIRTLRTAAGHAEPEPTLAASVAARRRSRRRGGWARVALAAAAVVLVAGGTTAVLSDGGGRARPAAEPTRGVEQAAEVWPEAMFTVPGTAVDGREYQPMAAISPAEVLVSAVAPGVKPDRLEVFDTGIRQFRTVTSMPKPNVPGYRFRDVKARDNHIVWWGETPHAGEGAWADFWYVPRAGGESGHVAKLTGELAQVDAVDITGDHIVFSVERGGVYRLPLTGGKPEKIKGTDGLHLRSWPLAAGYTAGESHERNQNRTVNLETGRSADVSVPSGARGLICGIQWCAGVLDGGPFRQRPDGSDRRPIPADLRPLVFEGLPADRFVLGRLSSGPVIQALYDLTTEEVVGLDEAEFGGGVPTVFSWREGSNLTVVNLLAVR
ncbi:hypothetical protein AB0K05_25085 [Nonomuraea sp. NPDC049486]|uniref:hypothetical protein n=1 Tax=Nonomuraea sp. NPDC049486 TaxID=3155773 RepID=UPI00342A1FC6